MRQPGLRPPPRPPRLGRRLLPARLDLFATSATATAISGPQTYFTSLGEQAADEITRLWAQMRAQAGNPPGEDYLHRVARLNALRKQAEEIVLAELILLPSGPGPNAALGT
ncbi:MAG: hypothetical protein ACRDOU_04785 [Streptosporangiaceae bacterium]